MRKLILVLIAGMFFTASANAQRQTKLYVDNGSGTFTSISSVGQGGTITLPSSGTLLTNSTNQTINGALTLGVTGGTAGTLTIWDNASNSANLTYSSSAFQFGSAEINTSGVVTGGGGVNIGGGGIILKEIKPASGTLGAITVPANGFQQIQLFGPGFANLNVNDAVIVEFDDNTYATDGVIWSAGVISSNGSGGTIYINLYNPTGADATPGASMQAWYTIIHQ